MMITGLSEPVTQITSGRRHVIAIDYRGTILSWGSNTFGQQAEDPSATPEVTRPREVKFFAGKNAVQIYAGDFTSCVITKSNILYFWGLV